jgi:aryl-alcohol dehydrogenase-like predicted oxidoreductase
VLAALDEIAVAHDTTVATVALAWLLARPRVVAPIARGAQSSSSGRSCLRPRWR